MSSEEETKIEPALKTPVGLAKAQERSAENENEGRGWDRAVKWIIIGTGLAFTATVVAVTLP
jgi:hypothetical protein